MEKLNIHVSGIGYIEIPVAESCDLVLNRFHSEVQPLYRGV
jgi:hypothetical protein